jgi:hypothetical protein
MKMPDMLEQHGSRDKLTRVAHQIFEQAKLAWLEFDHAVAVSDNASQQIHLKLADTERGALLASTGRRPSASTRAASSANAKGFTR